MEYYLQQRLNDIETNNPNFESLNVKGTKEKCYVIHYLRNQFYLNEKIIN